MRGFLGEKIGEGASADIHVWAPDQVVKLFKVGPSLRFGRHEARMTRAAFAAGAPEVFDEVTLEGRFGIVLQRLDGPTLLQLLQARAVTFEQVGAILATLYTTVHETPPPRRAANRARCLSRRVPWILLPAPPARNDIVWSPRGIQRRGS